MKARWPLAEALSNQPISDSFTFKVGIAQYRLGKVVSAWPVNAISIWRYSSYGRGITAHSPSKTVDIVLLPKGQNSVQIVLF
jgi:hypothetical protein